QRREHRGGCWLVTRGRSRSGRTDPAARTPRAARPASSRDRRRPPSSPAPAPGGETPGLPAGFREERAAAVEQQPGAPPATSRDGAGGDAAPLGRLGPRPRSGSRPPPSAQKPRTGRVPEFGQASGRAALQGRPPGPHSPTRRQRFFLLLLQRDPPPQQSPRAAAAPPPTTRTGAAASAPQAPRAARPRTPRGRRGGREQRHFRRAPSGGRKRASAAGVPEGGGGGGGGSGSVSPFARTLRLQRCRRGRPRGRCGRSAWRTWPPTCSCSGPRTTPSAPWTSIASDTCWGPSTTWNLSLLYLQRCSRIPSDALVDLIESLPSLKKLDLSDTQCNTQVLSAVGSTCRHLCELNISDCKRLSPDSLFHLAYDVTAGSFSCQGLQNSPCLKSLELFYLPFCLDEVFEKVLEPRGAALVRLRYLSLLQCQISISTIHLLLAADNQLNSLHLDKCPDIYRGDYDELLRKVSREGLDLHIQWQ
uniref:Uncharacterized protein n=1 Tax=Laticauda laticaudata TaxID=8630 RepID=A0A8C5SDM1_LATLA